MPPAELNRAPAAPAILKACVIKAGYTAKTIDFSLALFKNQANSNYVVYDQLCQNFYPYVKNPCNESVLATQDWLKDCIATIKEHNPRYIGLSVFSYYMHRSIYMLARAIREQLPTVKIVLGGYGVSSAANSLYGLPGITRLDTIKTFGDLMQQNNLTDHVINGDGENAVVELLDSDKTFVYNDTAIMDADLTEIPTSDFDDYLLDDYAWEQGRKSLTVTGSKGCVRQCTFCDIPNRYGKFKFKSGKQIAQEIIELKEKHGIRYFEFTDSLVNGSLKAFRDWVTVLAEYNDSQPEQEKIRWFGQYICRPRNQLKKDLYPLIKRSGIMTLIIGVESGNNEVLKLMKKQITVEDVFYEFDMFEKNEIPITVLMLSGFINETWDRYLDTLRFLIRCQQYYMSGTIIKVGMSQPLVVSTGSALEMHSPMFEIQKDVYDDTNWTVDSDPTNTPVERIKRRAITAALLKKLNLSVTTLDTSIMRSMQKKIHTKLDELRLPDSA
jgi:radical SAM superfamily enzyme YgiQ (UPF0313 family)